MKSPLAIFRPDFTWPRPIKSPILKTTPPTPSLPGRLQRRLWGKFHRILRPFSKWYCNWYGIYFDPHILDLPFGLVLKWHDRANLEEVAAMRMARAAGMPVPKVLSCGEHADYAFRFSILMTRLPGNWINNSREPLDVESEGPWLHELQDCVMSMRAWTSPYSENVCSALGTSIRSMRVPHHVMGPFANQTDFHDYLLSEASRRDFVSDAAYDEALTHANKIRTYTHRITFTHGDLKSHNILIGDDGHLSGFLDWESAGWCPEYWDFATAMRFGRGSWWFQVASWMGGDQYAQELECDIALNSLTVGSYVGF